MGGNCNAVGNMSKRCCAEYNFYTDPEAAKIVLDACSETGVPVTVLPWEACTRRTLSLDVQWRFQVLGRRDHAILRWLNRLERSIWGQDVVDDADAGNKTQTTATAMTTYNLCDAFMVGCLLFPERLVRRQKRRKCTVELQGHHTRGQMVVDHVNADTCYDDAGDRQHGSNITVIELLDAEACKNLLLWTVDALSADWTVRELSEKT